MIIKLIKRGDVFLVALDPVMGSEQGKTRPCLVIQNDLGNQHSGTTIVAAITSKTDRAYPFNVLLEKGEAGLPRDSLVMCDQLRTVSKGHRFIKKFGSVSSERMRQVDDALKISLALD